MVADQSTYQTELTNTLCGQNMGYGNVKLGVTYRNHCALKGDSTCLTMLQSTLFLYYETRISNPRPAATFVN